MKKILYILPLLLLCGCEDLLVRDPQDRLTPESFFKSETECELYTNDFYTLLPATSIYNETADVIVKNTLSDEVSGLRTVPSTSGSWNWDKLRDINFFLEHSEQCENINVRNEYDGLAKFFRAYFYFEKVKRYGDVPWVDHTIAADSEELYKGRDDRKVVMAHMLEDIDFAIKYLPSDKSVYLVNRWTALALKARIFLFEGTFRKYHGLGDWEECLNEAVKAAEEFIANAPYSLYTAGKTPYRDLFSSVNANSQEIILARAYNAGLGLTHDVNNYFTATSMGKSGMLKDVVNMYLMKDGSRFTDREGYNELSFVEEAKNRDGRLSQTICTPGYVRVGETATTAPDMAATMTGYQIIKYVGESKYDAYGSSETDLPVFRTAEVYLAYAEAKAELGTLTQSDLDKTVNLLRSRAGVASLNMAAANADPDPYLTSAETGYANVQGSNQGVILEIRRERTVELMSEGHRYWDIMRWKEGKRFERRFIGMYFEGVGDYDLDADGKVDFCIYDGDAPEAVSGVVYSSMKDLALTEGTHGNIVCHGTIERTWQEGRDYLYPIPTDDIVLTGGVVKQNPEWKDGTDF